MLNNSELVELLKRRDKQFKELNDIGIVSTENNTEDLGAAIQMLMKAFDERFVGVPFRVQSRNSDSYPYELVVEFEGMKFYILMTENTFKDRFWKPTNNILVNDKDVFSAEVVSSTCYECGGAITLGTQDIAYMNYCPLCGTKINKKEFTLTTGGTKNVSGTDEKWDQ